MGPEDLEKVLRLLPPGDARQDVIHVEGELPVIQLFGIVLADLCDELPQIRVARDVADGGFDARHLAVGVAFQPAEPDLDVALLAE